MIHCKYLLFLSLLILFIVCTCGQEWNLVNLDKKCFDCLCYAATECDITSECKSGYCGAYRISKTYWVDAGNITIPLDDSERAGAYEDCSNHFYCAQRILKGYLTKYGKDCNEDGVTDCYDYLMIHFNEGFNCKRPLPQNRLQVYEECMARPEDESF